MADKRPGGGFERETERMRERKRFRQQTPDIKMRPSWTIHPKLSHQTAATGDTTARPPDKTVT